MLHMQMYHHQSLEMQDPPALGVVLVSRHCMRQRAPAMGGENELFRQILDVEDVASLLSWFVAWPGIFLM